MIILKICSMTGRMFDILEKELSESKGNIIEIGAGIGETTRILLSYAKKYQVKVVVIDPHELGWNEMPESYGKPYTYQKFLENVEDYKENLIHFRVSSLDSTLENKLKNLKPFSFSFVDGLQYKEAVLSDLNLMKILEVPVICVDDFTRNTEISQVPLAVNEFIEINKNYNLISEPVSVRSKAFLFYNEN